MHHVPIVCGVRVHACVNVCMCVCLNMCLCGSIHSTRQILDVYIRKDGLLNVYLMMHLTHFIYGYMVSDMISSKGYFMCTIAQTG